MYYTTKPWDTKQDNPRQFGDLGKEHNQSRPMAMCGVEELGKVFIGTIPEYGQLGGVLAICDPKTDKIDVYHHVVPKQSITSLAYVGNVIVGGTSIWGGLGQQPEEKEAKLFLWDPAKNEKVFETTPVSGAALISGLFKGPDGIAWGMAGGTLFVFDVRARKVVFTKELFPKNSGSNWRDAFFAITPSGRIYGTANNSLFEVDPKTKEITVLRQKGAGLLSMDREGTLYFREGTHLWKYTP
jgi:hypothetical protein